MNVNRTSAPGANPEVWRIDEPIVTAPETPIPNLLLNPGDAVTFDAGGCVQTGGFWKTWKRYVNPSGRKSDRLYHGTVKLPCGVPDEPGPNNYWVQFPISNFVPSGTPYVVPPAPESTLIIGYVDEEDAYSDNGYYRHDNGTEDQCKGQGNAWIEVTITHAYLYENHFQNKSRHPGSRLPVPDYLRPDSSGLPRMRAGSNGPHSIEATPVIDADGVTIVAETNRPFNSNDPFAKRLASRTLYLLSSDLEAAGFPGLDGAGFLRAELEFDMPNAPHGGDVNLGWGVALNFKNGDETDGGMSDARWGPSCQFVDGGRTVNFHMTDGPSELVEMGGGTGGITGFGFWNYSFFEKEATRFKLAAQICRDNNSVSVSYGELYINDAIVKRGTLKQKEATLPQTPPLNTASDPYQFTAAGFAIVTQSGSPVQARFRSFTLQYQSGNCVSCQGNPPTVDQPPITY